MSERKTAEEMAREALRPLVGQHNGRTVDVADAVALMERYAAQEVAAVHPVYTFRGEDRVCPRAATRPGPHDTDTDPLSWEDVDPGTVCVHVYCSCGERWAAFGSAPCGDKWGRWSCGLPAGHEGDHSSGTEAVWRTVGPPGRAGGLSHMDLMIIHDTLLASLRVRGGALWAFTEDARSGVMQRVQAIMKEARVEIATNGEG